MKGVLAGLFAVATVASTATGAQAQSFNCHKAYFPDEKLICGNPELATLDERLNAIYSRNMRPLSSAERRALDRQEEQWVIARRRCGANYRCVEAFYHRRIAELADRLGDEHGPPPAAARGEGPEDRAAAAAPVPEPRNARVRRGSTPVDEPIERDGIGFATPAERAGPPATEAPREAPSAARRPVPADEPRQPAPPREAAASPRRATAPTTERGAPAAPRRTVETPPATTGGSLAPPRIEFADPTPGR